MDKTCGTCRHWEPLDSLGSPDGRCQAITATAEGRRAYIDGQDAAFCVLVTLELFGCNLWAAPMTENG